MKFEKIKKMKLTLIDIRGSRESKHFFNYVNFKQRYVNLKLYREFGNIN